MKSRKFVAVAAMVLLLLLGLVKCFRQDMSDISVPRLHDFVILYLGGNAWLHGHQPYTPESIAKESARIYGPGEFTDVDGPFKGVNIFYPPTAFLAILPMLLLPHQAIMPMIVIVSVASYLWMTRAMILGLNGIPRYLFLAFAINFAPFHSGLRPRNVTVLMAGMILTPLLMAARNKESSPWWFVLLGLGVGIRPQMGIFFLLILLPMREWKRFWIAGSTLIASIGISSGWLALNGIHWVTPLLNLLRSGPAGLSRNATESFVYNGVANFRLLNLSPLIYLFTKNESLSVALPFAIAGALFLCLGVLIWHRTECIVGSPAGWALVFGLTGAISILPLYCHYYGALLILPMFASLWGQWRRPLMRVILLTGAVIFSLPMPQFPMIWEAALDYFHHPGISLLHLSQSITYLNFRGMRPVLWEEIVSALPNLYLLICCLVLLGTIWHQERVGRAASEGLPCLQSSSPVI
jgi:hypothetical protein